MKTDKINYLYHYQQLAKGYYINLILLSVITPKTISHESNGGLRKKMLNFTRIVKIQVKFCKCHAQRCHFVKFDVYFLGLS